LAGYLNRIKIEINGTKETNYLDGRYERRTGRILAAEEAPGFEQKATVQFTDTLEEMDIVTKYIVPLRPTYSGEEVVVLSGRHKGELLLVRELEDENVPVVVSSKANPSDIDTVGIKALATMYDEPVVA